MRISPAGDVARHRSAAAIDHAKRICLAWMHSLSPSQSQSGHRKCRVPAKPASSCRNPAKPAAKAPYMRYIVAGVSRLLRFSAWEDARRELRSLPIRWDSYTVNQVLKTHPPMEKAWLFFVWVAEVRGFKHDHFTYTTMLDIFGEAGRVASMGHLLREMEEKGVRVDAVTYTSVLHWLAKAGDLEGSVRMWEEMRGMGCEPTVVSYTAFMKVLLDHGRPREAAVVYREMLEAGLTPTCHTYTVLIEYLAGSDADRHSSYHCPVVRVLEELLLGAHMMNWVEENYSILVSLLLGKFDAALGIMNKMQEAGVQPDKATCNILIQKCSKLGETKMMFQVLRYMKDNSLVLRLPIFLEAVETLRNCGERDVLLREVNPHFASVGMEREMSSSEDAFYDFNACIDQGIIFNLLARQNFVAIDHMLNEMISRNVKLDTELIAAIMQAGSGNGNLSTALLAFQYGARLGQKHEKHAYLSLIGPLIRLNCFQDVLKIVEEMIKLGHTLGTYLAAVLILRLGCARMSTLAAKLFYSLAADQNTVTYTALIHAHLQSSEIDKGLQAYASMRKEGFHVSSGTYEVLIVGLEEAGRNREAEFFKKEKKKLQFSGCSQEGISIEEILCDCIFN
ncbi:hypothetical protein Taro_015232 [Colocasia esculenta]|uniref:Pentatricopeptide repeat-containing protein n=1 Tax=Colocasia esculenta TaxID=4460 RepID=A0A843UB15_COLES|nr:hypothetical protein [Colocasia esculenta]